MTGEGYPDRLRGLVEEFLEGLDFEAAGPATRLVEAMRYSLLAGGKRVRPVLALAVAERGGREPREVLPFAAALELVHTYSLIHDDLPAIDDDVLRRGRPTSHVVFGEDVAILAGDGLFAEAFRLVLERQSGSAEVRLAALMELAGATGVSGMVGGQYMDVANTACREDELRLLHALKTGRLIEASIVGAALLCELQGPEVEAYRAYGREVGLLFQIVDDILDVEGDPEELGKSRGKDALGHKVTYVSRFGLERARALSEESHARALSLLTGLGGGTSGLAAVTDYIHVRRS